MAVLSDRYNLLFVMNPRTGCTALAEMMLAEMDGRWVPETDLLRPDGKILVQQKHTTIDEISAHNLVAAEKLSMLVKFTTIRNPFDSLVSLWTKKRYKYVGKKATDPNSIVNKIAGYTNDMDFIQNHSFADWVVDFIGKRKNQTINNKHLKGTDHYLRFESLQTDFDAMLIKYGISDAFEIPLLNRTKNRTSEYQSYYTAKAIDVVNDKFADELKQLGYRFEENELEQA